MPRPPQVPHLGGSEGADPLRGQKKRNKEQSRNKRARRRGIVVDAYGDNNEDEEEDEGEDEDDDDEVAGENDTADNKDDHGVPAPARGGGIPGGWRGVGEGIPLVFGCTWPWPRGAPSQERGGRPFVRAAEISTGAQDRSRSSRR